MRKFISLVTVTGIALLLGSLPAAADTAAIQTLARITINLNHFPSDEEKVTLKGIIDSDTSSEDEASIAMALVDFQHKVTEDDAKRLEEVVGDGEADASARTLAGILLGINHRPSDDDKATLAALAGDGS